MIQISILAPARGATVLSTLSNLYSSNFNSRPCERGDLSDGHFGLRQRADVNSRPCERGDMQEACKKALSAISILAPARGATLAARR